MHFIYLSYQPKAMQLRLMNEFYYKIYQHAFTDPNTSEDPTIWESLFNSQMEIILALDDFTDEVLGGIIFEEFADDIALVTYLAVHPDHQGKGIGRQLTDEVAASLVFRIVLSEVEDPEKVEDRESAETRMQIVQKYGWRRIPFDYVQPSLGPGKEPVHHLALMVLGEQEVSTLDLMYFLNEFYGSLGQIDRPELVDMRLQLARNVRLETHGLD